MEQDSLISDIIHNTTSIWVNTLDTSGNVVLWNRAAEKLSGYTREEVVGKSDVWEKLYPDPNYRQMVFSKAQQIIESHRVINDFESAVISKYGKQIILSWNSHNLVNKQGEVVGSIAIARDITNKRNERVRLQNALKETQDNLSSVEQRYEALRFSSTEPVALLHHALEQLAESSLTQKQQQLLEQANQAAEALRQAIDT